VERVGIRRRADGTSWIGDLFALGYGRLHSVFFRSGWLPALLATLVGCVLAAHTGHVAPLDVARFLIYLIGWIALPGTLIWRILGAARAPRPLGEDIAIGVLVGYVVEFPVYLACLALGHPHLYVAWPVVAVAASLIRPLRRGAWRRPGARLGLTWSWLVSGGAVYLLAWTAKTIWSTGPATTASLSSPYVDESYHLSLATSLKHFFPPQLTYVDDVPMRYHWLSHLHVAASSWASGVEPAVLMHTLAIPVAVIAACIGLAFVAARLTQAPWCGVLILAALLISPANFTGWNDGLASRDLTTERLLVHRIVDSPSAGFVNVSLVLGLLLVVELLRGTTRGWAIIALTCLTMLAMVGAKSASLPTFAAGLLGAAVIAGITRSRHWRITVGLLTLSIVCFLVAVQTFFRDSQQGTSVDPLHLLSQDGTMTGFALALSSLRLLGLMSTAAGMFLLIRRGGWRRTDHVFLIGVCASGIGAALTFGQGGLSEYYFAYVVFIPILLASVMGVHRAVAGLSTESRARLLLPVGTALGVAWFGGMMVIWWGHPLALSRMSPIERQALGTAVPMATVIAIVCAGAAVGWWLSRRHRARVAGILVVAACAGIGLAPTTAAVYHLAHQPAPAARPHLIGAGGITAARWLRHHSDTDDLVATNAHCAQPGVPPCSTLTMWMAAYSERHFLVSGWAYVIWTVLGIKNPPATAGSASGPFWNPSLLRLNDDAFFHPSKASVRALQRRGVRWLFVDRRFPVRLPRLTKVATLVHSQGDYAILRVRHPAP
jgi:hypothetical protein